MQDDKGRPSTETEATPKPPVGEDVKALVTPGDDAAAEADAESVPPGADEVDHGDKPEKECSPTRGDR